MGSASTKKEKPQTTYKSKKSNGEIMPFFKKQSAEAKKILQHKLYLARESPESTFDIAGCELSDVPTGVYSLCRVLQKEALLVHNNWLSSLKGGGDMVDLSALRVLDLHDNELSELPDDLGCLKCLQVLNISCNKIKELPDSLGNLSLLQTLNASDNKLSEIPRSLNTLQSLRTLDVSKNRLSYLDKDLCQIRTLENMILDADSMTYPPSDICTQGTEEIMKYLCSDSGVDYIPPSKFLLDVLDAPKPVEAADFSPNSFKITSDTMANTIQQYENVKEKKRLERLSLEKALEEEQRQQAELATQAHSLQQKLVATMANDQARMHGELTHLHMKKEMERQTLIEALAEAENEATFLVQQMLEMNEKARKTEELMEELERERIEAEQWFTVRKEEEENLRKKEVLIAMEGILEETEIFEQMRQRYISERDHTARKAHESADTVDQKLEMLLTDKQTTHNELIESLMKEEKLQKEAFVVLQLQKDACHHRIRGQIQLIQDELAQLTLLEVEQREMRIDTHVNILEEKRQALTKLLIQLMEERTNRELELKKRLNEMEEQRVAGQEHYWLIQYQRLMDRKPQSLIDQEHHLEYTVVSILQTAGAADYLPQFAAHRITIETLCQMQDADLRQIGMREVGLRQAVLTAVEEYKQSEKSAEKKTKLLESPDPAQTAVAGATSMHPPPRPIPAEVVARINSECVVCMENESDVVFLNCGHVCCCGQCGLPLSSCPLCRADIVQKVKLSRG